MPLTQRIEDNKVIWTYENLRVIGIVGRLDDYLSEVSKRLQQRAGWETAPIKVESQRDFLAVFDTNHPVVDITLDRHTNGEGALVLYTLSEENGMEVAERVLQDSRLQPIDPAKNSLVDTMGEEIRLELTGYRQVIGLAQALKTPVETVFATVRYANQLHQYHKVAEGEALKRAGKKFNLELPPM